MARNFRFLRAEVIPSEIRKYPALSPAQNFAPVWQAVGQLDLENGNCEQYYNSTGTWTLTGDNLSVTLDGETINPTFFELTNNTLRVGYYDNDENDPCDGGNLPSHYYTEYTRVE